jgi:hypothetical protein
MKRYLDEKESHKAGEAVGVLLYVAERLIAGEVDFTVEQYAKMAEANEIMSDFTVEEQAELFAAAMKEGAE